jgi:hypothetical protein
MWDWYNRPGGWHDRGKVPLWRLALLMIGMGLAMGIVFYVLYAALAPAIFSKVPS